MPRPDHSFTSIAGAKTHYARPPLAPYGSMGNPYRFYTEREFASRLESCFEQLWQDSRLGTPLIVTSAGAWVDKPGHHQHGNAFDLDGVFWENHTFITLQYPSDPKFYLGVEAVVRQYFGTVLNYHFNASHEDHLHIDSGTDVDFYPSSRSRVLFLQAVLREVFDQPTRIDGAYGDETSGHLKVVMKQLGLRGEITNRSTWNAFLKRVAETAFNQPVLRAVPIPIIAQPTRAPSTAKMPSQILSLIDRLLDGRPERSQIGAAVANLLNRDEIQDALVAADRSEQFEQDNSGEPRFKAVGKMSTFGGPADTGVSPSEGLALVTPSIAHQFPEYFLDRQPPGTTGLARRLDPNSYYIACRWNYDVTPKAVLRNGMATVTNVATGAEFEAKPVDWGPADWTGRVADLSPKLAADLNLDTDDEVEIIFT